MRTIDLRSKFAASVAIGTAIGALAVSCATPAAGPAGDAAAPETAMTEAVGRSSPTTSADRLAVVATTTIVGDVVSQVGGSYIDLSVLLPTGVDPHSFDATPQDAAAIAESEVVFTNGLGLESFLDPLLRSAGSDVRVVAVSEGISPRQMAAANHADHSEHADHAGREGLDASGHMEGEGQPDPHVWFAPNNVMVWADNIATTLGELDPAHAAQFDANATDYTAELRNLDKWVLEQVATIPAERRRLVTDHQLLGYFADRYGFEQVGNLLPGLSTLAEPSAAQLATLQDAIVDQGVRAVFVGTSVNPQLAERVAEDTGCRLVEIYTGSLSEPGGPADTYLEFMRYNVSAIVEALK